MNRNRTHFFASIPHKANRILSFSLVIFFIFIIRLWYLTVIQHTSQVSESRRGRTKIIVEPAMRGTIRDRFNVVLAANTITYRVGVQWSLIQEIPKYFLDSAHNKQPLRAKYIQAFSKMLAQKIDVAASRIEDCIYSYAIFSRTLPIILKSDLTEQQYYRLNMLTKEWPGLVVERAVKRTYPLNNSLSHIIGYTSGISREKYDSTLSEIRTLSEYVHRVENGDEKEHFSAYFTAKKRLFLLEKKRYRLNDEMGRLGIEASFEDDLRGLSGSRKFITNAHGEPIKEAEGSQKPIPGKRILLSISAELQQWCERLLTESEMDRHSWLENASSLIQKGAKNPLVRGGAIIALDPKSSEIYACASFPRFNLNDFVHKQSLGLLEDNTNQNIHRWLEDDTYLKKIWEMQWPVLLEKIDDKGTFYNEQVWLTWDHFLKTVSPSSSPLSFLTSHASIETVLHIQEELDKLSLELHQSVFEIISQFETNPKIFSPLTTIYFQKLPSPRERALFVDLSRLLVRHEELSFHLKKEFSSLSLPSFRSLLIAKASLSNALRQELEQAFLKGPFEKWKQEYKTSFLAEKRKEERAKNIPSRPFLQYLDKEQKKQFEHWWNTHQSFILLSSLRTDMSQPTWTQKGIEQAVQTQDGCTLLFSLLTNLDIPEGLCALSALQGYDQLTHPLYGKYSRSIRGKTPKIGQDLIHAYLSSSCPSLHSLSHSQPSAPGSIFKLIPAYAAVHQCVEEQGNAISPSFFTITDVNFYQDKRFCVAKDAQGKAIPRLYKGGRIPKSMSKNIGKINLVQALAKSSNPYFSLLAGDVLKDPKTLLQAAQLFGYGEKTGLPIPGEAKGRVPMDLDTNKTGLYTTAIGQHTLLATPLQSALMLSALTNGGTLYSPKLIRMTVGPDLQTQTKDPYETIMSSIGFTTPIWIHNTQNFRRTTMRILPKKIRRTIPITECERNILLEGMKESVRNVMKGPVKNMLAHRPHLIESALHGTSYMIGKSSTAESYESLSLCQQPFMYNHIWYGAVFFPQTTKEPFYLQDPELVVLVFLKYGRLGKDAAILATSVAQKWKEICQKKQKKCVP